MRKAARKQKKLDKLANASQPESIESEKFDKNTIVLPQLEEIQIVTGHIKSTTFDGELRTLKIATCDFTGLAGALRKAEFLERLIFTNDYGLIDYISEALKFNTSVKFLTIRNYFVLTVDRDAYLQSTFPRVRDILQYNRLTTLCWILNQTCIPPADAFSEFINGLKNNTSLTSLTTPALRYQPEMMQALVQTLNNHPQLVDVTFPAGHQAPKEGWKYMADVLLANRLRSLSFETQYHFIESNLGPVFDALTHNTSLTLLSFAQRHQSYDKKCASTAEDCELLYGALQMNQTLTKLDLSGMQFGSDRMSKVFDALQHHTSLTELNFWENNNLNSDIAPALSSFLQANESLTELDLSYSNITADALQLIGPALNKNRSITSLNLFMNPVGSEGCKYLAEGLRLNKTLIRINLKDCKIEDKGCVYLGEAIKTNQCLLHLDISGYQIKSEGYKALIEGMRENDSLTDLTVSKDKSVPEELHKEIVDIQNRNKAYQREILVTSISILIQIARADVPMFPLEIWLRIFKHLVCGGVPGFNHIAEKILMQSDGRDLRTLCKMKIVRINGKSHLVSRLERPNK